ncbi:MAG: hypothetical protein ABWK05_05650, partial [Pyrobaculum sp.]
MPERPAAPQLADSPWVDAEGGWSDALRRGEAHALMGALVAPLAEVYNALKGSREELKTALAKLLL